MTVERHVWKPECWGDFDAGLTKVKAVELKAKIEKNVFIINLSTLSMHGHRS